MTTKPQIICQGYKGTGLISRAIRIQTRSEYSHIAAGLDNKMIMAYLDWLKEHKLGIPQGVKMQCTDDDMVLEAWHTGGVVYRPFGKGHKKGTRVNGFEIDQEIDFCRMLHFMLGHVGDGYDWRNVFRILARRVPAYNDKWFCNELYERGVQEGVSDLFGSRPLQSGQPASHTPRDCLMSPLLNPRFVYTRRT